jgi:hypothetical protein
MNAPSREENAELIAPPGEDDANVNTAHGKGKVQGVQRLLSPAPPSASIASCGLAISGIDAPHSCHYFRWIPVLVISLRGISTIFSIRRLPLKSYHMSVEIHFLWLKGFRAVDFSREVDEIYGQAVLSHRTVEGWLARFQTKKLLSLPNYSLMIPTAHRKRLLRFSASARKQ